jgi:hypothetical protein
MYTLPRESFRRLVRLFPTLSIVFLFAALLQGCAKDSFTLSPLPFPAPSPFPPHPINLYPTQTPFQAFVTKYNVPVTNTSESIWLTVGDFGTYTRSGTLVYYEAELGFAFRTSVAGSILGLGTLLPATGFAHTVTLWDSATQVALATTTVTGQSASVFTYTDFASTVPIQANHGYVVGYNTLAIGIPVDTFSTGNDFYLVDGILVDGGQGSNIPLFPFTEGTITVENAFKFNYGDGQPPANLFPTASNWGTPGNGFFGLCDIAFMQ